MCRDPICLGRVVISNIQMQLGNNFTREHLIRDLANNQAFVDVFFDEVVHMENVEEVEIISTERFLMQALSRVVQETFVLDELYAELKQAVGTIPEVFIPNPYVS